VINHSTGESFTNSVGLAKYTHPDVAVGVVVFGAGLLSIIISISGEGKFGAALFTGVIAALIVMPLMIAVLWFPAKIVASIRASQMKRSLKNALGSAQMA